MKLYWYCEMIVIMIMVQISTHLCRFIMVMPSQLDLLSSCLNVFTQLVSSEPKQVYLPFVWCLQMDWRVDLGGKWSFHNKMLNFFLQFALTSMAQIVGMKDTFWWYQMYIELFRHASCLFVVRCLCIRERYRQMRCGINSLYWIIKSFI